MMPKIMLAHVI